MSWSLLMLSELMQKVIIRFIEISGIVDHHYLTFAALPDLNQEI